MTTTHFHPAPTGPRAHVRWLLAAIALASAADVASALSLAGLALPPGATLELVADDLVQHGRPLSVATFRSGADVEAVLGFYAELWPDERERPGHVLNEAGAWRIVSRFEDGANLALQLRPSADGGSEGLVSVMDLAAPTSGQAPPPVPPGGRLLSTTGGRDGERSVRTHVVSATGRAGEVAGFYRDAMERAGWRAVSDREAGGTIVLMFRRRDAGAELVVAELADGSSTAVLNEIDGGR